MDALYPIRFTTPVDTIVIIGPTFSHKYSLARTLCKYHIVASYDPVHPSTLTERSEGWYPITSSILSIATRDIDAFLLMSKYLSLRALDMLGAIRPSPMSVISHPISESALRLSLLSSMLAIARAPISSPIVLDAS